MNTPKVGPLEDMTGLLAAHDRSLAQERKELKSLWEQYEAAVADEKTNLINLKEDLKYKVKSTWWQSCKMLVLSCFRRSEI